MQTESIEAYDLPERVRRYDADMDIMHPLRWKMIDIALAALPFPRTQALKVLDLGVGTGVFTERFLNVYPASTVVAVDGAESMLNLAAGRLGELADRVQWVQADFLALPPAIVAPDSFDVAISSYALHHLDAAQKLSVLKSVVSALTSQGWILNADIVVGESDDADRWYQRIRVAGITGRAPPGDERFQSAESTRATLAEMEAAEQDQPQKLSTDLRIFREAGIENVEVLWKEFREAVIGGVPSR